MPPGRPALEQPCYASVSVRLGSFRDLQRGALRPRSALETLDDLMTPADGKYWSLTLSGWEARRDSQLRPATLLLCAMDVGDDGLPLWRLLWRSADVGAVERARSQYGEHPNARLAE